MDKDEIINVLRSVEDGRMSADEALSKLKIMPFEDLGFAKIDYHRAVRQGEKEVIYGAGKTPEQIYQIASAMVSRGCRDIIVTRVLPDVHRYLAPLLKTAYDGVSRVCIVEPSENRPQAGNIAVISAGTSDMPVSEEAAVVAEALGNRVERIYDVGVSGIHRLFSKLELIQKARVIIVAAGMEGALVSVVGGLVDCPVIALPTSVGYGASFGGVTALLAMLNSCSSGVSVVNIDNGFGAGYLASMINHMESCTGASDKTL